MEESPPLSEDLNLLLHGNPSPEHMKEVELSGEFQQFVTGYTQYINDTVSGKHGSTAKFWMIYIQLVYMFLRLDRACRTNDVDLFIFTLGEMISVFFSCNRPNYARWMTKYFLDLLNMENTHPGIRTNFENGALSIRRSDRAFARCPVDIVLEQTVNADAASRTTGISAFALSEGARNRWMMTHSVRSSLNGALLNIAGLQPAEETAKSLQTHRVKKDNEDIGKIIEGVSSTMNPFAPQTQSDDLYCLSTGVRVSDDVKQDLLGCLEKGSKWKEEFLSGCIADPKRFEKPIPRRKVKNFVTCAPKTQIKSKDLKVVELQGTRDLFGRLLYLSTMEKIDMEMVFKYPLTPVPLSLANLNGTMNHTDKAKLLHKLEERIESDEPRAIDITVVDASFFMHTIQSAPQSYGKLAELLLQRLCSMSQRIDFVCDTYISPSLKDTERRRRSGTETTFKITGPDQRCPRDLNQALKSSSFKTEFVHFLADEWTKEPYAAILVGQKLYLALESVCYKYEVINAAIVRDEMPTYASQHEEADTRMIFHLANIFEESPDVNVVVRSNDTDVLILLVYHVKQIRNNPKVWMDLGVASNNTRRYINIR